MAQTQTNRFKLPQWSAGTDSYPGRTGFNNFLKLLEDQAAIAFPSGLLSNRPLSGAFGRFYLATDQGTEGRLYYDGGSGWIELNTNGGGGAGTRIVIGRNPTTTDEGGSNRSARADHIHTIPLATKSSHGAMASQDKELLNDATSSAVANALIRRTSSGNVYLPSYGQGDNDAVPKRYVDDMVGSTNDGSASVIPNALVRRTATGHVYLPASGQGAHDAVHKEYVDNHNWAAGDITSGQLPGDRVRYSTWAYNTAWGGSGTVRTVHVIANGELCFYSSTRRHKTNITDYSRTVEQILGPVPTEFDRLNPETLEPTGTHDQGFIAEDAGEFLPELVQWGTDENGDPQVEGWNYEGMITGHQKVLREHQDRIREQDEQIRDLKETVANLTRLVEGLTG